MPSPKRHSQLIESPPSVMMTRRVMPIAALTLDEKRTAASSASSGPTNRFTLSAADEFARFWRTKLRARSQHRYVENGSFLRPTKHFAVCEPAAKVSARWIAKIFRTCMSDRQYYYPDVPGLGNVAVSRHAQERMDEYKISQAAFERALLDPIKEVEEGTEIVWRERDNVRIVIVQRPVPFRGAKLVKTVMKVGAQAGARGRRS
jgi:hypothetical protein